MESYVAIPHLRDMLIPPYQRKSKQDLWKKALDFLLANESRLRSETQLIAGEEFEVLRWLQVMILICTLTRCVPSIGLEMFHHSATEL